MSEFSPYNIFMDELRTANRKRLRIVSWRLNYPALDALAYHPITAHDFGSKPLLEREFLGIPLELDRDDRSEEPRLEPVYETHGRSTLIHDYPGDILHGNDKDRFVAAIRQTLADNPSNKGD